MVTVVDPAGSPSVTFNLSGTAIFSVSAGGVNNPATATVIPHYAGETLVAVASSVTDSGVIFDDGFEIGDVVEVYSNGAATLKVFPASGDTINLTSGVVIGVHQSALFRKYSSADWSMVRSS